MARKESCTDPNIASEFSRELEKAFSQTTQISTAEAAGRVILAAAAPVAPLVLEAPLDAPCNNLGLLLVHGGVADIGDTERNVDDNDLLLSYINPGKVDLFAGSNSKNPNKLLSTSSFETVEIEGVKFGLARFEIDAGTCDTPDNTGALTLFSMRYKFPEDPHNVDYEVSLGNGRVAVRPAGYIIREPNTLNDIKDKVGKGTTKAVRVKVAQELALRHTYKRDNLVLKESDLQNLLKENTQPLLDRYIQSLSTRPGTSSSGTSRSNPSPEVAALETDRNNALTRATNAESAASRANTERDQARKEASQLQQQVEVLAAYTQFLNNLPNIKRLTISTLSNEVNSLRSQIGARETLIAEIRDDLSNARRWLWGSIGLSSVGVILAGLVGMSAGGFVASRITRNRIEQQYHNDISNMVENLRNQLHQDSDRSANSIDSIIDRTYSRHTGGSR